jgi:hypothetical protein
MNGAPVGIISRVHTQAGVKIMQKKKKKKKKKKKEMIKKSQKIL